MTLSEKISELQNVYDFKIIKPMSQDTVEALITKLGLNTAFLEFYLLTNGLAYEWFRVLSIEDPSNIKRTWDSIQKANDLSKSKFELDEEFLNRFVVFAEIGAGKCAVFDKTDGSIWYEENDDLQRTDLDLETFLETCLKEVEEL